VTENLSILELEVEQARAKLAKNLAFLRSPRSYQEFRGTLKSEAQSVVERVLDDVKARAAANPSAALAIGAGIAWRLLKDPPIAMALIGAGVISLWRTTPLRVDEEDYLSTAQQRFGEQVGEAVETVKNYAAETVTSAQEKASDYAQAARQRIQGVAASAAEEAAERIRDAREAARHFPDQAADHARRATTQFRRAVAESGVRDQLLLGVAGFAVVAALGLAYQGRSPDELGWE
jgi:hypothetical protein